MNEMFIEEIRKYPQLFDKTHRDFKDVSIKKTIWAAVGAKFGISEIEAEKKWRVQRDRYTKEKRKIRESTFSGAGTASIYKSNWNLYKVLDEILRSNTAPNDSTISNIENNVCVDDCQDTSELATHTFLSPASEVTDSYADNENIYTEENIKSIDEPETDYELIGSNIDNRPNITAIKKRKHEEESTLNEAVSMFKNTSEQFGEFFQTHKQDKISHFCALLECRLRQFNELEQLEIMHIFEIKMLEKEREKFLK